MTAAAFSTLLESVQMAGEDYEWYPTTDRMIAAVARWMSKGAKSIMDIGAGDGRVLTELAKRFETPPTLYAIEKSSVLIQAQPDNVIPVGTELFEQNLACLPVDYIFCNPPYSDFETWVSLIIETGHAKKAFLVIPRRWDNSPIIAASLQRRGATTRVIHSDDFLDAIRRARAVVDIVEVSYPMKESHGWRSDEVKDPFDIWFDENVSTFEQEQPNDYEAKRAQEAQELARVRSLNSIHDLVESYTEEYERMQENYRSIFRLDYALLKELGVNKDAVRDGIKTKMAGLKSKYWHLLFERLDTITERLSTRTREKFLERLTGRVALAFTANNAYAVVLWAIKNANAYFGEQTVQLFRDLSTFDGVANYKSNTRTWQKNGWRFNAEDHSRYALDYRIVAERHRAIINGDFASYEYEGDLHRGCHHLICDVVAVFFNLGFQAIGPASRLRQWTSGEWQDWRLPASATVLFQVKAHKNGNLHFRFLPDAIRALNVEAGRLLGWLRSPDDVETELGYARTDAARFYGCTRVIAPSNVRLIGEGMPHADIDLDLSEAGGVR